MLQEIKGCRESDEQKEREKAKLLEQQVELLTKQNEELEMFRLMVLEWTETERDSNRPVPGPALVAILLGVAIPVMYMNSEPSEKGEGNSRYVPPSDPLLG